MPWIEAKSEAIKAYTYDANQKRLRVRFRSSQIYDYEDVDTRLFAEFVTSPSQGAFLNHHIKPDRQYKHVA